MADRKASEIAEEIYKVASLYHDLLSESAKQEIKEELGRLHRELRDAEQKKRGTP